jgi:hypothetical protein
VIDPGENRLTEVTAAVFDRVRELAQRAAVEMLSSATAAAGDRAMLTDPADPMLTSVVAEAGAPTVHTRRVRGS